MSSIKSSFVAKDFARRVKQRRKTLMLPMTQLAKKLGVSEPEYNQIESGDRPPSRKLLTQISIELRTSEKWLIEGGY
ncbi:DNA-binding XRE family transcriptional regulator [Idiomarina fontislapidosi]|uniref:Transcriptional regulator n=1 Tax=Idiomarina fontislapidosi TaxID=263723 RepID=A0A432Y8U1_9GAMM|nr:helix-turn-helix transcriptional regulator [Idiomarina fontislapidosi]PYE34643.1 DNA-binding XRE family transcriptional regulator [Idiomarina fontislapidosi]RUO57405.1 transcriptional regulator [Idiomarina fontislapidosi]|tara:strand:- start:601 stop:831 length:231 start_codon:yes stop_codon:yes gene_type:complete